MKILITGANGFLGKSLTNYFERLNRLIQMNPSVYGHDEFEIISLSRKQLDLLDKKSVYDFFHKNQVDVVLNTAAKGGKRSFTDNIDIVYDNILMFENLARYKSNYKFMINFGSGAELDRNIDIGECPEHIALNRIPTDYYGFSKNIIAKRIEGMKHTNGNIFNFRIFNVFSEFEDNARFIKSALTNYINKKSIIIHKDRWFDTFYMQDLISIIHFYILNYDKNRANLQTTLNICYSNKMKLSQIADYINTLDNYQVPITFSSKAQASSYTGRASELEKMKINFIGLENGIKEVYGNLKMAQMITQ